MLNLVLHLSRIKTKTKIKMEKRYCIKPEYNDLFSKEITNKSQTLNYYKKLGISKSALIEIKQFTQLRVTNPASYFSTTDSKITLQLNIDRCSSDFFTHLTSDVGNIIEFIKENFDNE